MDHTEYWNWHLKREERKSILLLKYWFGNWHQLCVKSRQLGADTIVFHSIYYKNIGKMAFQPHAILDRIFGHHQRDQKLFLLQKGLGATRQRCWKKMLFWNKCQVQWLTYKQCFLWPILQVQLSLELKFWILKDM